MTIPLQIRITQNPVTLTASGVPYGISMQSVMEFAFIVEDEDGNETVMTPYEFACHTAACRPPTSGGTGGSSPLANGPDIAPRFDRSASAKATGKKEKLGDHKLSDFSEADQKRMVADFVKVTGLSHLKTPEDVVNYLVEETDRQMSAASANDPDLTARHWYNAAHSEAENLSRQLGAESTALGSSLLAVTSPQTPWPDNVAMAREITRLYNSGEKISRATLVAAYNDKNNKELASAREKMTEAEFVKAFGKETWATIDTRLGGAIFKSHLQYADPKVLAVDQVLTPGGNGAYTEKVGGAVVAKSGESGWKALEILNAHAAHGETQEFYDVLSARLGDGSKVRSFYNNINNPDSPDFVTIDTHAAAGMTGFPAGSGTPLVKGVMTPGSVTQGMSQGYPLYQEAINRVAAKWGVLPREVQSITWVQQRDVEWPDTVKSNYTNTGPAGRPIVSHLQRQMALSMRGSDGVAAGRVYRDQIRDLTRERAAIGKSKEPADKARVKEIQDLIKELDNGLGLSDNELREARKFAAPPAVYNAEKKQGVTVP